MNPLDQPPTCYSCVVADDHPAILDAVCLFLESSPEFEVAGRASNGEQALQLIRDKIPHVAILDVRMPLLGGIEVARRLAEDNAATNTILYTGFPDRALLLEALDAGARGFLVKEAPLDDMKRAIKIVASGGTYVDPALAIVVASPEATERLLSLTQRQRQILRMIADGMRNDDVAMELNLSTFTVRTHLKHAMQKLEADTRTEEVRRPSASP